MALLETASPQDLALLGRAVQTALPVRARPSWTRIALIAVAPDDAPGVVREIEDASESENDWYRGRELFERARNVALTRGYGSDPRGDAVLRLAEIVAKVTYNATYGPAPYDDHAICRVPGLLSVVLHIDGDERLSRTLNDLVVHPRDFSRRR